MDVLDGMNKTIPNMKRTLLIALGAMALALNAKAQHINVTGDIHHWVHDPGAQLLAQAAMRKELREEVEEYAAAREAAILAKNEHAKWIQSMYKAQAERNARLDAAFALDAATNSAYHTDLLPLCDTYDNAATIKIYLRDCGFNDLSAAQIVKVGDYMKANHILHVSQIDPIGNVL